MVKGGDMKGKEIDVIIAVGLLAILVVLAFLQVVFRFVLNLPLAWSEEFLRFTYIFMVGLATSIAIKDTSMIRIEFLELFVKNEQILHVIEKAVSLVGLLFVLFVAVFSIFPLRNAFSIGQVSPALRVPVGALYAIQMLLYFVMAIRFFMNLFNFRKHN